MKKAGSVLLHLYAGEKEGFTLQKAMEEHGLGARTLEVDIKRGEDHDLASLDSKAYKGLLRLALDGDIAAVLGGPNCRTRSVLWRYPGGPRPARTWSEPWGVQSYSPEERKMCEEDDILMWRQIFLFLVADIARKLKDSTTPDGEENVHPKETQFLLEQPADPKDYMPECVSFWGTSEWKSLQQAAQLKLHNVNQGDFEPWKQDAPVKPTGLAGLCRAIAEACAARFKEEGHVKVKKMTWEQHCQNGHVPFRRDCRTCQEQSAKSKPHRKVMHPLAATLSLDTAGPYTPSPKMEGKWPSTSSLGRTPGCYLKNSIHLSLMMSLRTLMLWSLKRKLKKMKK